MDVHRWPPTNKSKAVWLLILTALYCQLCGTGLIGGSGACGAAVRSVSIDKSHTEQREKTDTAVLYCCIGWETQFQQFRAMTMIRRVESHMKISRRYRTYTSCGVYDTSCVRIIRNPWPPAIYHITCPSLSKVHSSFVCHRYRSVFHSMWTAKATMQPSKEGMKWATIKWILTQPVRCMKLLCNNGNSILIFTEILSNDSSTAVERDRSSCTSPQFLRAAQTWGGLV